MGSNDTALLRWCTPMIILGHHLRNDWEERQGHSIQYGVIQFCQILPGWELDMVVVFRLAETAVSDTCQYPRCGHFLTTKNASSSSLASMSVPASRSQRKQHQSPPLSLLDHLDLWS
jgi:hypothetical protein